MYPTILTIVLIGVVLGLGIFIMSSIRTEVATTQIGTDDNVNVTGSDTGAGNYSTLGDASKDDYTLTGITELINETGDTVPSSNYTWTAAGVVTWTDTSIVAQDNPDYLVNISSTYTYDVPNSPEEAINDSLEGLAGFAGWIAIIMVVIAAAIVLGIVLNSFGREGAGV